MTRLLRMKEIYIDWTKNHWKHATTRFHQLKFEDYELTSGSRYKPKKSGIIIQINNFWEWTRNNIAYQKWMQEDILNAEDSRRVKFKTWQDFIDELESINGREIGMDERLYTNFYWMRLI